MNTNAATKPRKAQHTTGHVHLSWLGRLLTVPGCQVPCRKHTRVCRHWIRWAHLQHPQSEDASVCTNGRYAGGCRQKIKCTFSHTQTHTHMHALTRKKKRKKKGEEAHCSILLRLSRRLLLSAVCNDVHVIQQWPWEHQSHYSWPTVQNGCDVHKGSSQPTEGQVSLPQDPKWGRRDRRCAWLRGMLDRSDASRRFWSEGPAFDRSRNFLRAILRSSSFLRDSMRSLSLGDLEKRPPTCGPMLLSPDVDASSAWVYGSGSSRNIEEPESRALAEAFLGNLSSASASLWVSSPWFWKPVW